MLSEREDHFVSVADAFRPSSATDSLDPSVRQGLQAYGNKWSVVWAEATLASHRHQVVHSDENSSFQDNHVGSVDPSGNPVPTSSSMTSDSTNLPSPWQHGHLMDILLGSCLALAAVCSTFGTEIGAAVLFIIASGFYYLAEKCRRHALLFFCYTIFTLIVSICLLVDTILLAVSVLVTEIMANVALILCFIFAGPKLALEWRQYIRRMCHLMRWAFRDFHSSWKLKRSTLDFLHISDEDNNNNNNNNNKDDEAGYQIPTAAAVVLVDEATTVPNK